MKTMKKEIIDKNLVKLTENEDSVLWFVVTKEIQIQVSYPTTTRCCNDVAFMLHLNRDVVQQFSTVVRFVVEYYRSGGAVV